MFKLIAILAAILNLVGAVLVSYSYQATSTNLIAVTTKKGGYALCAGDGAAVLFDEGKMRTMEMPANPCPEHIVEKPISLVKTDSPELSKLGWLLIVLGFLLQLVSIVRTSTKSKLTT